jgi:uncharacterized protein (DUF305 family)
MQIKKILLLFTLGGVLSTLTFGLAACTGGNPAAQQSPNSTVTAQSPESMAGMDHSSMNMDLGPKDQNFDLRFLDAMILHHQGAVVMAQDALQKSNRPEIKQLAQEIIAAQEREIQQMQGWRKAWYPLASSQPMMWHAPMGHMMSMSEEMKAAMMMNVDLGAADDQYDLRFLNAMIPHHEGALMMAQDALAKSDRTELKQLSQAILDSQQAEIDQMKQWRKAWYGQ